MSPARVRQQETRAKRLRLSQTPVWWWWRWWWWFRHCYVTCGADSTRMPVHTRTRLHHQLKWTSASALVPSAGLASWKTPLHLFPPKAGSRRPQVQTVTQPQGEEKDCEARPPRPPLLRRKGSAIFSISLALDAPGPGYCAKKHLDVSFW